MARLILFFFLGTAFLFGSSLLLGKESHPNPKASSTLSVTIAIPRRGGLAEEIPVSGVTVPREEIQVMTELSGARVRGLLAEVGDSVKQGQALAVLDSDALENEVARLRSEYERTRDASARADALKDSGAVTRESVVNKRGAMQAAKALLDTAELNLRRATVRASQDGVIYERSAVVGALVQDDTPLFRLARHGEIELEAMVPEADLPAIALGQPVSVKLAGVDTPLEGAIRRITPRVDKATRMTVIRVRLPPMTSLPVGLFATARIALPTRMGMLLPRTAVQRDAVGDFVWVLDAKNQAERRSVSVALFRGDLAMVESIPPDARVVARAGAFVKDGDRLNVAEAR